MFEFCVVAVGAIVLIVSIVAVALHKSTKTEAAVGVLVGLTGILTFVEQRWAETLCVLFAGLALVVTIWSVRSRGRQRRFSA